MPRLSAAVMAHPSRADMVDDLLRSLDRPVPVVWDRINDRHDTGIRSLEAYDPAATHHLVVQDDTVVARDLLAGVERALRYIPQGEPMCLYVGKVRPFRFEIERVVRNAGNGASWLTMCGVFWGPAIVVPTAHIDELAAWWRTPDAGKVTNYDRRVSAFYALRRATCWYTWPSLVDHADTDSLVKGHGRGRRAHNFVGVDASALDIDWSGPVVDVPRAAKMDDARQLQARRAQQRRQRVPA